jgi:hypothetical protein
MWINIIRFFIVYSQRICHLTCLSLFVTHELHKCVPDFSFRATKLYCHWTLQNTLLHLSLCVWKQKIGSPSCQSVSNDHHTDFLAPCYEYRLPVTSIDVCNCVTMVLLIFFSLLMVALLSWSKLLQFIHLY